MVPVCICEQRKVAEGGLNSSLGRILMLYSYNILSIMKARLIAGEKMFTDIERRMLRKNHGRVDEE